MGNNALSINKDVFRKASLDITTHGSDWYFTVCAIMGTSTLVVVGLSLTKPANGRIFHQISASLLMIATVAYFSMGSDLGQVPILAEFMRHGDSHVGAAGTRSIFYARYIDWALTTPLLLLDLLLTAALPWPTILAAVVADEVMVVSGLIGALVSTRFKWGYWVFGMCAFFYVAFVLLWEGRRNAAALGGSIKRTYNMCGVLTIFIWFLYPIAWGVSEGGNIIHPDSEAVFYGILDIIAKPVFTFMLLWGHNGIDPAELGLHIGSAPRPAVNPGMKEHHAIGQDHPVGQTGVRNGVGPEHDGVVA